MKFFESRLVHFENTAKPELSADALSGLKDKKEASETAELSVDQLVADSNKVLDSYADQVSQLPPEFSKSLHDNIVQYFLTSADRYDKDAEKGLDAMEFGKYSQDMLAKLVGILDTYAPSKEQLEAQEKQKQAASEAKDAVEAAEGVGIEDFNFDEENLQTPEGIEQELTKYNKQGGDFREKMSKLVGIVGDFQKSCQKFEDGKKEWGVFLRGNGFMGLNIGSSSDRETDALKSNLGSLKSTIGKVLPDLETKQKELADYGDRMNQAGDSLRQKTLIEREQKLAEIDGQDVTAETSQKKNEEQYSELSRQQEDLSAKKLQLDEYVQGLQVKNQDYADELQRATVQSGELEEFDGKLGEAISTLDGVLQNKDLPEEQKKAIEERKAELLDGKNVVAGGLIQSGDALREVGDAKDELVEGISDTQAESIDVETYLAGLVLPAVDSIEASLKSIELAKMKNGTQREQVEVAYIEKLNAIDNVDAVVADSVLQNSLANQKMIDSLTQQKNFLDTVDIDRPGVWDATGGLLLGKIGEGWGMISNDILDPLGGWVKDITKDVPVLNVVGEVVANIPIGLVSGVCEGVGELVSGINMMVSHPLETAVGMSALVGRNPSTGEYFDGSTAGTAWKGLGKALIAWDEFEEGNVGKGIGKVALNVLMTATGGGAALNGAKGASIAYSAAIKAGAGVTRAGLQAAGTGAKVFALEFSSGISKLSGEAISGVGRLVTSPMRLARGLKETATLGKAAKLEKAMSVASEKMAVAKKTLEGKTIGGKKISEIEGLAGKTFEQVKAMSSRELAACGINDARSIREFMGYKSALKTAGEAGKSLALAGKAQVELEAQVKLASEKFKTAQKKFDAIEKKIKDAPPEKLADLEAELKVAQAELKPVALDFVEKIRSGALKGFENYQGIRDLGKAAGLSMEEQYSLAKRFLETNGKTIYEMIRMDDTVGVARLVEITGTVDDITRGAVGVEKAIPKLFRARSLADMDAIISTVASPVEKQILEALASDLKGIGSTVLEEAERVTILKESLRYLVDYKLALREGPMGVVKSSQDVFDLIRNNQRKLAHQTIVDRNYFTGSDHGVTHILDANMKMAEQIFVDMGGKIPARQRVLIRQAILDHDMGYTINTLENAKGGKYHAMTKDHPLYSTIWCESNKAEYVKYFGEDGYATIRKAILDHSNAKKLDFTATGGQLVENIVAGVDCLGVTADIKMAKLFRDPEMMAELLQLKDLSDALKAAPDAAAQARTMRRIEDVKTSIVEFINNNSSFSPQLKDSYLRAIERNFDPKNPDFAFKRDFGSHSAGYESLKVAEDGSMVVKMSVNENFRLVREMFAEGSGDAISIKALAKAMDDYGLEIKEVNGNTATVIRDGVEETLAYSQAQFAADLALVESGKMKSLVVKTPRATFDFVKNAEKGKELSSVLRREQALREAITELGKPDISSSRAGQVMSNLAGQNGVWDGYLLNGVPATRVMVDIRKLMIRGQIDEAVELLKDLRYKGTKIG